MIWVVLGLRIKGLFFFLISRSLIESPSNNCPKAPILAMRKRERENPCGVCGHYHKYEEGEICGICGHRAPGSSDKTSLQVSAFPSEILPEFLYLGSYDNASRSELLKTQGISHILNTVPTCQNLYKNSFTYYCLQDEKNLQFDDANQFLEQCERDKARVLVHCMSGRNRSPAFVIAFLMKSKGWKLAQSYQWVKDRRPPVQLNEAVYQQLQEYEAKIFGSVESNNDPAQPMFNLSFPKVSEPIAAAIPAFGSAIPNAPSIFDRSLPINVSPNEFNFGSNPSQVNISGTNAEASQPASSAGDIQMD